MIRAHRRRVAGVALLASLLWLGLPLTGLSHQGLADDTACGVEALGLPGPLRVSAAVAVNPVQHCAICHLQRASRGAQMAPIETAVVADWTNVSRSESPRLVVSNDPDRQPARAPPASAHS